MSDYVDNSPFSTLPSRVRPGSRTCKQKKSERGRECILPPEAAGTLGSGDLRQAVRLPIGEDLNEWIAINTVDFFTQINMLYGTLAEFCTDETCRVMSAGPKYQYYWADGQSIKKPIKCPAPQYVNFLMCWVHKQLENEAIFPSKIGVPFPPDFQKVAKTILKRLFRVYAHIYCEHFHEVRLLDEAAHLNTSFKHFVYFVLEFDLVRKSQLEPLQHVIEVLLRSKDEGAPLPLADSNGTQKSQQQQLPPNSLSAAQRPEGPALVGNAV